MTLGAIWRKTGKRKEGEKIPKPGTQVEYKGKKYVSLKELSKDINVPYSPLPYFFSFCLWRQSLISESE